MNNNKIQKLTLYCLPEQMALKALLQEELQARGRETIVQDGFLYSEGKHPVLLIAHMDTVHEEFREHGSQFGDSFFIHEHINSNPVFYAIRYRKTICKIHFIVLLYSLVSLFLTLSQFVAFSVTRLMVLTHTITA